MEGAPRPGDANPDDAWRLRKYFRAYTLESIEKLALVMRGSDPKLALTAAAMILDRGWGKPVQQMEIGKPGDFAEMTDEQLEQFIIETERQIAVNEKTHSH